MHTSVVLGAVDVGLAVAEVPGAAVVDGCCHTGTTAMSAR